MLQSFGRGLSILDLFTKEKQSFTLEEIAEEIGVSPITAYRYVKTLADHELVVVHNKNVQLSSQILRFVNLFWEQDYLVTVAREHIEALNKAFNETVALCKLEQDKVICVYRLESSLALRSSFQIGQKMSLHAGAFARTIASFLDKGELNSLIKRIDWKAFTEHTIASPEEYFERLNLIRERGYDISVEEVDPGVVAIAVPILLNGKILGGLGFALPSVRYEPDVLPKMIEGLQECAKKISDDIKTNNFY